MIILPSSDVTQNPALSDLTGLNAQRLYMNLRTTAMLAIMTTQGLVFTVDMLGKDGLFSMIDALCMSIAVEVVNEIQSHSNLMAIVRDTGPAGAGIITGYVK